MLMVSWCFQNDSVGACNIPSSTSSQFSNPLPTRTIAVGFPDIPRMETRGESILSGSIDAMLYVPSLSTTALPGCCVRNAIYNCVEVEQMTGLAGAASTGTLLLSHVVHAMIWVVNMKPTRIERKILIAPPLEFMPYTSNSYCLNSPMT